MIFPTYWANCGHHQLTSTSYRRLLWGAVDSRPTITIGQIGPFVPRTSRTTNKGRNFIYPKGSGDFVPAISEPAVLYVTQMFSKAPKLNKAWHF